MGVLSQWVWKSVVSFPSGNRGEAPTPNAFSAYSGPQNASRRKNSFNFQLSSAVWTTDPTVIFVGVQSYGDNSSHCPLTTPLAMNQLLRVTEQLISDTATEKRSLHVKNHTSANICLHPSRMYIASFQFNYLITRYTSTWWLRV